MSDYKTRLATSHRLPIIDDDDSDDSDLFLFFRSTVAIRDARYKNQKSYSVFDLSRRFVGSVYLGHRVTKDERTFCTVITWGNDSFTQAPSRLGSLPIYQRDSPSDTQGVRHCVT